MREKLLYGVACYRENMPEERFDVYIRLMNDRVIYMGESPQEHGVIISDGRYI